MQTDNKDNLFSLQENIWQGLTLTMSAANQIQQLVKGDPKMLGLRLGVKRSGCAGFSYVIEKAMQFDHDDQIYENNGARIYVSIKVMPFIDGTELDYIKEGLNYAFKFNNPKIHQTCGCGISFSI